MKVLIVGSGSTYFLLIIKLSYNSYILDGQQNDKCRLIASWAISCIYRVFISCNVLFNAIF